MSDSGASNENGPFASAGVISSAWMTQAATSVPVPDHELLRKIGNGSFGEVWLARNMLGTYRAVKIVHRSSFENQRPFDRELAGVRNFEPISRSHEGFVDVLHAGVNEQLGYFYYVMELGDDMESGQKIDPDKYSPRTLSKTIASHGKLSAQDSLQLGLALSLALTELHKDGLIHRDIKPSNIIFVNGVPKLADIGLVTGLKEAPSFGGTEGFIPPEGPGTPQADVYGLGKVLYEASTGMDRVEFPNLPTLLNLSTLEHNLFLELNEVILEACQGEARNRFSSAWEMHARLLVIANGGSVRRLRSLERRWANVKRAVGIAAVGTVVVGGYGLWALRQLQSARELHQRQVSSNLARGNQALEAGDLLGSLPYFAEALTLDSGDASFERDDRLRIGSTQAQCPKLVQMWFLPGEVGSVALNPDDNRVLAIERLGKAQIFDTESGKAVSPRFGQDAPLWRGGFSPDGSLVTTASQDGTACVWRAADGKMVLCLAHPGKVHCSGFSPDGSKLVTGCQDNVVRIWNCLTGKLERELTGHTNQIRYVAFSPDGRRIVSASEDHSARLWDAHDGHLLLPPMMHERWVVYAAFSPDGKTLVTASDDHTARFWNAATGEQIRPELNHLDGVSSVDFSPDGRFIATAGLDWTVRLWEAESHKPLHINAILRHSDRVLQAVFSPDGRRLVTACADGTVRVWDLAGGMVAPRPSQAIFSGDKSHYLVFSKHSLQVWNTLSGEKVSPLIEASAHMAKLSQDGRYVLAVSGPPVGTNGDGSRLQIWETQSGKECGPPISMTYSLQDVLPSRDGKRVLAFGGSVLRTWDVVSGSVLVQSFSHSSLVRGGTWSPAGDVLASWDDHEVHVWNCASGRELFAPIRHTVAVKYVEFSPDGSRIVTCSADERFTKCCAQAWNASTGKAVGVPMKHNAGVECAHFSPSGTCVATAGDDFAAIVWSASTGERVTPPAMHTDRISTSNFSPDGQWFVTAGADRMARIWSAATGDPLTPWLAHPRILSDGRFLANSCAIATSDNKGRNWIWRLPLDERPPEDLVTLSRLLSGDSVTPWGRAIPHEPGSLERIWRTLRKKYPAEFTTSSDEIVSWHEFQAANCEHEGNWRAAADHLRRCLAARPGDPYLINSLESVNKNLPPST